MFDFNNHLVGSQARKLLLQRKSQIKINGVKKTNTWISNQTKLSVYRYISEMQIYGGHFNLQF